jgi:hypothetical protein
MRNLRGSWLLLALLGATACSPDCGTDENATARSAAGSGLLECGRSYYGNISCDPADEAVKARLCFLDAARVCKPAHFWREMPGADGRFDDDLYVVPVAGGGCKIHIVHTLLSDYCPDPLMICDAVTSTNWDGDAGKCPLATGVGCTGGFK